MHSNVEAALKLCSGPFRVHRHDAVSVSIHTAQDFANAIGYPLERICKCLFLRCSDPERFALALISCSKKTNISSVAQELGCAGIRIATPKDLQRHTDYPPKGVSPLGVKNCPLFIDAGVLTYDTILIGAGVAGEEIEVCPGDLIALTNATVMSIGYEDG